MTTAAIIFISVSVGALFGMMALGICAASGRGSLESENMMLRAKLKKLQKKHNVSEHNNREIAYEGTD